jgi:large subunit ribosomal protein L13
MLPHNKLGHRLITKLKVYAGSDHPHDAQVPETITAEALSVR